MCRQNPKVYNCFAMDSFDADLQQLLVLFQNMVATLRREKEELSVACQQFELVCIVNVIYILGSLRGGQERQHVVASNVLQTDRVKVYVGGSLFHVSRAVLTAEPNSLLDSLFSGGFRVLHAGRQLSLH